MPPEQDLSVCEVDLFRAGNAGSPRLDHVRSRDVTTYERHGKLWVRANDQGVSVFTWEEILQKEMIGWIWRLPAGRQLPIGLKLFNDHGGHYVVAPNHDMTVDDYLARLRRLAVDFNRVVKR
jgi:hypothetical protein